MMLTTAGLWSWAIVRKVVASIAPVSGALLVAGTFTDAANDDGARSSLEAMTMPETSEASAMKVP